MPKLHLEVFPPNQRRLWDKLRSHAKFLRDRGYYLAGGSGLALQMGHRQSLDFDFFSTQKALSLSTQEWLQGFTTLIPRDINIDTFHGEADGVKVSFISGYRYKTVEPSVSGQDIPVAGLTDIGLMKLLALTHRAALRDYLDLAVLLRGTLDLRKLLKASKKKYGTRFNEMVLLRALVTFGDIEMEMPVLLDRSLEASWKKILCDAVKKAA